MKTMNVFLACAAAAAGTFLTGCVTDGVAYDDPHYRGSYSTRAGYYDDRPDYRYSGSGYRSARVYSGYSPSYRSGYSSDRYYDRDYRSSRNVHSTNVHRTNVVDRNVTRTNVNRVNVNRTNVRDRNVYRDSSRQSPRYQQSRYTSVAARPDARRSSASDRNRDRNVSVVQSRSSSRPQASRPATPQRSAAQPRGRSSDAGQRGQGSGRGKRDDREKDERKSRTIRL